MHRVRYLAVVAVIFSLLRATIMMMIGAEKTIKAYRIYFLDEPLRKDPPLSPRLTTADQTMISVVESIDAFLIGLVLLIFSLGVYNLFVGDLHFPGRRLHVNSIEGLKKALMELILVVLTVIFLRALFLSSEEGWRLLVIPTAVALFVPWLFGLSRGGRPSTLAIRSPIEAARCVYQTFEEFPSRQRPASFSVDQIMEGFNKRAASRRASVSTGRTFTRGR